MIHDTTSIPENLGQYDLSGSIHDIYTRLSAKQLAERLPFVREEFLPVHATVTPGDMPSPVDAVRLDARWVITCAPAHHRYAEDLRACLSAGYGLTLGTGAGSPTIILSIDPTLSPQAHRITVTPTQIEIAGGDEAGVMYGVHRLEERLLRHEIPAVELGTETRTPLMPTRIYRSFAAPYYVDEWATGEDYYPDDYLDRLAHHGFNGIWVHATLRECARSPLFPTYGEQAETHLTYLQRLISRAAQYHIRVYLYMTEPLGMAEDDPLWEHYPHLRGAQSLLDRSYALCTTMPEVREHIRESTAWLARRLPGLGGIIQISASEHHHHCWSHVDPRQSLNEWHKPPTCGCPRCAQRLPQEVVSEVITLVHEGLRAGAPTAEHIVWNWSWAMYEEDPQRGIIERLPHDVMVMGDFERGLPVDVAGAQYINEEYSLALIGPSRRYQGLAQVCRELGVRHVGRIQVPVTHETSTIPYWAVYTKLAEKCRRLVEGNAGGTMACWNFGNFLGLGTELLNQLSWSSSLTADAHLREMAERHFGVALAPLAMQAWERFSAAADAYPNGMPFLYNGPLSRGPALPFFPEPTGQPMAPSYMLSPLGDQIADCLPPFTLEALVEQLRKLYAAWQEGVALYAQLHAGIDERRRSTITSEYACAGIFGCQVRSSANFLEFIHLRDAGTPIAHPHMQEIVRDELDNCRQALVFARMDMRIGFHGEAQAYLLTPQMIEDKIAQLTGLS
ncbi:MAG: glycoside hydrolase family 20 zincin-like fold domain-containing protein [Armatimonadota bacterium]